MLRFFILFDTPIVYNSVRFLSRSTLPGLEFENRASLAQLAEHALRKHMVVGSIPTGGLLAKCFNVGQWMADAFNPPRAHYLQEALGDGGRGEIVDHGFGVGFAPPPPTIHYLQTGAR